MADGIDKKTERYFKEILGLDEKEIEEFIDEAESASPEEAQKILNDRVRYKRSRDAKSTTDEPDAWRGDSAAENYGYINKPAAMGFANYMPGPIGMASKMVNGAINVSNTEATNTARGMLGMEQKSMVKGAFNDGKGYVGDVSYNGVTSPVGFEASTPDGRTTLTPNEARMRQQLSGAKEATKEESKANTKSFKSQNPRGLISRVFGNKEKAPAAVARATPDYTPPSRKEQPTGTKPTYQSPNVPDAINDPDLPARDMAGVSIENRAAGRSQLPTSDILGQVQDVVTDTLGAGYTVHMTSGMEPEGASPVGSKYRHPEGFAADLKVSDPAGNMVSINDPSMRDVAVNAAGRYNINFGAGEEYMGDKTVHMDNMDLNKYPGAAQWGSVGKEMAGKLDKARNEGVMADSYYDLDVAPTPTTRPEAMSMVGEVTTPQATAQADVGRTMSFSPEDRDMMARTLAGEIDPRYTDLDTPEGIREANGIMSTMENRVGRFGSIQGAITAPNAYSTWGTQKAADVANANFEANPQRYQSLVDSYAADKTSNMGFTSYHNPSISNPGWGAEMAGAQDIGPHRFGSLSEFGTNFGQFDMTKQTVKDQATPSSAGVGVSGMAKVNMNPSAAPAASTPAGGFSSMNAPTSPSSTTSPSSGTGQSNTGSSGRTSDTSSGSSTGGGFGSVGASASAGTGASASGSASASTGSSNDDDDNSSGGGSGGTGGGGW